MVAADEVSIARYYKDRGYLDARVGSRLVYAPNGREVIVEFLITEGPRYTVRNISVLFDGIEGDAARFSEEQIVGILKEQEAGDGTMAVCRRHGISAQTFYRWKRKYAGMGVTELRRLKQLEDENRKLKQLVADLTLDKHMLQEVIRK